MISNREAIEIFKQLRKKANLLNVKLIINYKNKLNASSNNQANLIWISHKDLATFSKDDLEAILGHELGHFKQDRKYQKYSDLIIKISVLINVYTLCLLVAGISFKISASLTMIFTGVMLLFDIIFFFTSSTILERVIESDADVYSAKLVGKNKIINLLNSFYKYNQYKLKYCKKAIKLLTFSPIACFKCISVFLTYRIETIFSEHFSNQQRIKYVKNYFKAKEK